MKMSVKSLSFIPWKCHHGFFARIRFPRTRTYW